MRFVVLGGGGFRTPQILDALLDRGVDVDEMVLYDVDENRLRLIDAVLDGLTRERGVQVLVRTEMSLDAALEGAEVIFCTIRVGGLRGRIVDERVPLQEGVPGQETTGPGGISFALRTVPVMLEIARAAQRRAPQAWFLNLTNPAGLVTEAILPVLGDRVIGICDTPAGLSRRVAMALGKSPDTLHFSYVGLNHLGWLVAVYDGHQDLLPALLADDAALGSLHEAELFGLDRIRTLGAIPNEYLVYYERPNDTVTAFRQHGVTRAEFLFNQQQDFYAAPPVKPETALRRWRHARDERHQTYMAEARGEAFCPTPDSTVHGRHHESGHGYADVALDLIDHLRRGGQGRLILNVRNDATLPFLPTNAIIEAPCSLTAGRPVPIGAPVVPGEAKAMIERIKDVERLTIRAATTGSRRLAVEALARHPIVPSREVAERIFEGYLAGHTALRERFT